ncbi:hypothetical protein B0J17DRAFT_315840 [Rhizoctonia solani]|nr:hypothetical protein B0J17DRAFT_315840 [Rhizoctonia solani]
MRVPNSRHTLLPAPRRRRLNYLLLSTTFPLCLLPSLFLLYRPSSQARAEKLHQLPVGGQDDQARNRPRYVITCFPREANANQEACFYQIVDDRKYQCDFCPVQMARLHDINRHMRIHTGVHPYACIGCGETFRRTDARTRHWCKQPECFRIHSAKAPASKVRRRIP